MRTAGSIAERLVLDTDIVSNLLNPVFGLRLARDLVSAELSITYVTVGELHRGAEHASWGPRRREALTAALDELAVIPGDADVARRWGVMTGSLLRAGRPLPANDSWIAACCLHHDLPLLTYNPRDFAVVPGLRVITLK